MCRATTLLHIAKAEQALRPNPWPPTIVDKKYSLWHLCLAFKRVTTVLGMAGTEGYITAPDPKDFKKAAKGLSKKMHTGKVLSS